MNLGSFPWFISRQSDYCESADENHALEIDDAWKWILNIEN